METGKSEDRKMKERKQICCCFYYFFVSVELVEAASDYKRININIISKLSPTSTYTDY